jgi:hypothetical protein
MRDWFRQLRALAAIRRALSRVRLGVDRRSGSFDVCLAKVTLIF